MTSEQPERAQRTVARQRLWYWGTVFVILVGSVCMREPALHANIYADDWDHYAIVEGIYPIELAAWDMFNWVPGDSAGREALLRTGRIPWWASSDLHLSVFRPLPSLLAHFDYTVLDGVHHPLRLHLHTLCWWVALILGVAALMQQRLPLPIATLAVAMYAVDDAHIVPFAWIANRSEIVALAFVAWALWLQAKAHADRSTVLLTGSFVLVIFALGSGEHAIPALALFGVTTLFWSAPWSAKLRELAALGLLIAAYMTVRAGFGYGIAGSGFYIDPLLAPLRFASAAVSRVPVLLGDLVFSIPSEWWHNGPPHQYSRLQHVLPKTWSTSDFKPLIESLGVIAGLLTVLAIYCLRRSREQQGERAVTCLTVGALVSLAPLCGMIAAGRMTLAPAIGLSALFAYACWRALVAAYHDKRHLQRTMFLAIATALLVVGVGVPAARSHDGAHYMNGMTNQERVWVEKADFGTDNLAGRRIFLLAQHDLASQMAPYILHAAGRTLPVSTTMLSPRGDKLQVLTRTADNTFELEVAPPKPQTAFCGSVYRSEADAFRTGDKIVSTDFTVTVLKTWERDPHRLRFTFTRSLDDPSWLFMIATNERHERFVMPRIGEHAVIQAARGP